MTDLDPAAIKDEHEWHHQTCAVLLSPGPLTLIHCLPYRLADSLAKERAKVKAGLELIDENVPPDNVLRMNGRWIELPMDDLRAALGGSDE